MAFPRYRALPLLLVSLLAACAAPQASTDAIPAAHSSSAPVEVGIIAINDFHGALDPPRQSVDLRQPDGTTLSVPAGGAAWLASAVDSLRTRHPNNVVVGAGDLTGAS